MQSKKVFNHALSISLTYGGDEFLLVFQIFIMVVSLVKKTNKVDDYEDLSLSKLGYLIQNQ